MTSTIGRKTRVDSFAMLAHSLESYVLTVHNFVYLVKIIPQIRGARVLSLVAGGQGIGVLNSTTRSTTITVVVNSKIDRRGGTTAK